MTNASSNLTSFHKDDRQNGKAWDELIDNFERKFRKEIE